MAVSEFRPFGCRPHKGQEEFVSILGFVSTHKLMTVLIAGIGVFAAIATFARVKKVSPVSWGWYGPVNVTDGLALKGYDPVSYHNGEAKVGSADVTLQWNDVEWRFATVENRERFEADPERYAPAFGGFCSFAVSKGFTAVANPEAWHINAGRLHVFDSDGAKAKWLAALDPEMLAASDRRWNDRMQ